MSKYWLTIPIVVIPMLILGPLGALLPLLGIFVIVIAQEISIAREERNYHKGRMQARMQARETMRRHGLKIGK